MDGLIDPLLLIPPHILLGVLEGPLRDSTDLETALRWTSVLHLDLLYAPPVLQLEIAHHHRVDADRAFLSMPRAAR